MEGVIETISPSESYYLNVYQFLPTANKPYIQQYRLQNAWISVLQRITNLTYQQPRPLLLPYDDNSAIILDPGA
jgi:hypothetical protein